MTKLAIIGLLLPTVVSVYSVIEKYSDAPKRKKTTTAIIFSIVLILLAIGGSVVSGIEMSRDNKDAEQWRNAQRTWQTNTSAKLENAALELSRIGATEGNEELRKSYFNLINLANAQYNSLNSAPKRKDESSVRRAEKYQIG
jgi:hypothetical protein